MLATRTAAWRHCKVHHGDTEGTEVSVASRAPSTVIASEAKQSSGPLDCFDPDVLLSPDEIAAEIVENFETALERFKRVAASFASPGKG